jgi:4-hydroxy-3-polyprenylbenzoate decarboxylase
MNERHLVLAITGASGAVYGLRLAEELLRSGVHVSLLISRAGFLVLREECDISWTGDEEAVTRQARAHFAVDRQLTYYGEDNFLAPLASGSAAPAAMVIAPCSMGSLARIAAGLSANLLERSADVMIKEKRQLILVPRETPLSSIHLENMLKLSRLGVEMVPAMPAFYHQPQTIAHQVDFIVGKVLDRLGIPHALFRRWGAGEKP